MPDTFLALQNTYRHIEIALFKDQTMVSSMRESKLRASKTLVPLIEYTLLRAQAALKDLSFIAVNQGPGPFTTLRTIIATANGISFASQIPLVGVDGLKTFVQHHASPESATYTIALLNAFNNDVYYAISHGGNIIEKSYKNINNLLEQLGKIRTESCRLYFVGNGTKLHKEKIAATFSEQIYTIPDPLPITMSLEQLGSAAYAQWHKNPEPIHQLQPLYLKKTL